MNPEEKQRLLQRIDALETLVDSLLRVDNVSFIENIKRRMQITALVRTALASASIDDFGDVDITSPSSGQVLKYTTSGWVNGTDNT